MRNLLSRLNENEIKPRSNQVEGDEDKEQEKNIRSGNQVSVENVKEKEGSWLGLNIKRNVDICRRGAKLIELL